MNPRVTLRRMPLMFQHSPFYKEMARDTLASTSKYFVANHPDHAADKGLPQLDHYSRQSKRLRGRAVTLLRWMLLDVRENNPQLTEKWDALQSAANRFDDLDMKGAYSEAVRLIGTLKNGMWRYGVHLLHEIFEILPEGDPLNHDLTYRMIDLMDLYEYNEWNRDEIVMLTEKIVAKTKVGSPEVTRLARSEELSDPLEDEPAQLGRVIGFRYDEALGFVTTVVGEAYHEARIYCALAGRMDDRSEIFLKEAEWFGGMLIGYMEKGGVPYIKQSAARVFTFMAPGIMKREKGRSIINRVMDDLAELGPEHNPLAEDMLVLLASLGAE